MPLISRHGEQPLDDLLVDGRGHDADSNRRWFALSNHKRVTPTDTVDPMDSRKLLAKNLAALMARSPDLSTQGKLHRKSKVAQATIGRALRGETGATLDTLDALAAAFGVSPWTLIHPNPDVKQSEAALYSKLRELLDQANGRGR